MAITAVGVNGILWLSVLDAVQNVGKILKPCVRWNTVRTVQRLRCKRIDAWVTYFPLLGNEIQYVLVVPYLVWCCGAIGRVYARQFSLLAFAACTMSNSIKELLQLPRPPKSLHLSNGDVDEVAEQFGCPSTHSAHAISQAWLLAKMAVETGAASPTAAACVAAVHVTHVCTSRLYLGVHSLCDILVGLLCGLALIFAHDTFLAGKEHNGR